MPKGWCYFLAHLPQIKFFTYNLHIINIEFKRSLNKNLTMVEFFWHDMKDLGHVIIMPSGQHNTQKSI